MTKNGFFCGLCLCGMFNYSVGLIFQHIFPKEPSFHTYLCSEKLTKACYCEDWKKYDSLRKKLLLYVADQKRFQGASHHLFQQQVQLLNVFFSYAQNNIQCVQININRLRWAMGPSAAARKDLGSCRNHLGKILWEIN